MWHDWMGTLEFPGPGNYKETGSTNKRGVYFNSNQSNSKAPVMSKASRFMPVKSDTPGPGAYTEMSMSGNGNYFYSSFRSSMCRTFTKDSRFSSPVKSDNPGPGTYRSLSTFSYWESENPSPKATGRSFGFSGRPGRTV